MRYILSFLCLVAILSCSEGNTGTTLIKSDTPPAKAVVQKAPVVASADDFQNLAFTDLIYIPKDSADKMIRHGKSNNCKKAQGVTTYFTKGDIQQLTNIAGVTSFRLVLGCFLGDVPGDKKNRPTLLLEVEFAGIGLVPTYLYYSSRRICPLPPDCS